MVVPGRSNAFDISKQLGLNMKVIQNEKAMIGHYNAIDNLKKLRINMIVNKNEKAMIRKDEQEIKEMIASLEKNYKRVNEQRIELDSLLREAQETHDELEKEYDK